MNSYNASSQSSASRPYSHVSTGTQDELWVAEQCREAIGALERAMIAPPLQLAREASTAARLVVKMRDKTTEWLRQGRDDGDTGHLKTALERINAALTLILGVEYPSSGVRRKPIEQARDLLNSILVDGLF